MVEDLAARVLAAITEVECVARAAPPGPWTVSRWEDMVEIKSADLHVGAAAHNGDGFHGWPEGSAEHIALHDPAAVLRRCAADRELIEEALPAMNRKPSAEQDVRALHARESSVWDLVLRGLADGYGITE